MRAAFFAAAERFAALRARVPAAFFAAALRVDFALAAVLPEAFPGDGFDADRFAGALRAADFFAAGFFAPDVADADFLRAGFFFAAPGPFAPPSCLLTVAHARLAAVFFDTPFFS
ncbi:MAG TPA: hypothetical protein VIZ64_05525 [Dokdonella sp.]